MPSEADPDVHVQFTVKELLSRIDGKIDILTGLIHEKADKADLNRLDGRVAKIERESATSDALRQNTEKITAQGVATKRQWVAIAFSAIGTLAAIGLGIAKLLVLHQ